MKQSAVEFLLRELGDKFPKEVQDLYVSNKDVFASICLQAKEMEKQHIMDAHFQGIKETVLNLSEYINIHETLKTIKKVENGTEKHEEGEDYYNKTFN